MMSEVTMAPFGFFNDLMTSFAGLEEEQNICRRESRVQGHHRLSSHTNCLHGLSDAFTENYVFSTQPPATPIMFITCWPEALNHYGAEDILSWACETSAVITVAITLSALSTSTCTTAKTNLNHLRWTLESFWLLVLWSTVTFGPLHQNLKPINQMKSRLQERTPTRSDLIHSMLVSVGLKSRITSQLILLLENIWLFCTEIRLMLRLAEKIWLCGGRSLSMRRNLEAPCQMWRSMIMQSNHARDIIIRLL